MFNACNLFIGRTPLRGGGRNRGSLLFPVANSIFKIGKTHKKLLKSHGYLWFPRLSLCRALLSVSDYVSQRVIH